MTPHPQRHTPATSRAPGRGAPGSRWHLFAFPLLLFSAWGAPSLHLLPQAESMARDVAYLSTTLGPRPAGSGAEERAARYLAGRFAGLGFPVKVQQFRLPNGRTSANVLAGPADRRPRLIIGGHYDSRPGAPGADDNASGVAAILEAARALGPAGEEILFIAFGSEERTDANRDHHHYGSRHFVRTAPRGSLAGLAGMICVDCVGTGNRFYIQGMRSDGGRFARLCRAAAWQNGARPSGGRANLLSDHEPFGRAGIPVAAYLRQPHPLTHTPRDTADTIRMDYVREAAACVIQAARAACRRP